MFSTVYTLIIYTPFGRQIMPPLLLITHTHSYTYIRSSIQLQESWRVGRQINIFEKDFLIVNQIMYVYISYDKHKENYNRNSIHCYTQVILNVDKIPVIN